MFPSETKFLVADDTKTVRVLIKDILANLGYATVEEAPDGSVALKLLKDAADKNVPFGFIIADLNMPGLTGVELLDARNKDAALKDIPFLMITTESERDYVLKAVSMGVSDFIVKPFSESTIKSKIQSIWNRNQRKKSN